jgi:hypothetical protein
VNVFLLVWRIVQLLGVYRECPIWVKFPLEKFKPTGQSGFLPRGGGAHALETQDIKAFGRTLSTGSWHPARRGHHVQTPCHPEIVRTGEDAGDVKFQVSSSRFQVFVSK